MVISLLSPLTPQIYLYLELNIIHCWIENINHLFTAPSQPLQIIGLFRRNEKVFQLQLGAARWYYQPRAQSALIKPPARDLSLELLFAVTGAECSGLDCGLSFINSSQ